MMAKRRKAVPAPVAEPDPVGEPEPVPAPTTRPAPQAQPTPDVVPNPDEADDPDLPFGVQTMLRVVHEADALAEWLLETIARQDHPTLVAGLPGLADQLAQVSNAALMLAEQAFPHLDWRNVEEEVEQVQQDVQATPETLAEPDRPAEPSPAEPPDQQQNGEQLTGKAVVEALAKRGT